MQAPDDSTGDGETIHDHRALRALFPIAGQRVRVAGRREPQPLIYLDNGASTHPPRPVLDTYRDFLERSYSNVHRGRHRLSRSATDRFERTRDDIRRFISARGEESTVILLGNTSQALDLAAHVMAGVEGVTLVSLLEHHSNDLPHRRRGQVVRVGLLPDGTLDYGGLERLLRAHRVRLVALTGASNVTGYLPDIDRVARLAHAHGARILVDAAQLLAHARIDVRPEGHPAHIDFLAAAGHKAYAPFGSSFLFAPRDLCDRASPYVPAGGTVFWVSPDDVRFRASPERHEGGTPNIAGAVGLAAALGFLERVGLDAIRKHERALTEQALDGLGALDGVTVLGHPDPGQRTGVVSFNVEGVPHEVVATRLDREGGIAVRDGCFCAQPYVHHLLAIENAADVRRALESGNESGLPGAVRASLGIHNTAADVAALVAIVRRIRDRANARTPRRCGRRLARGGARSARSCVEAVSSR
jgi:cysteine desulfurase/selenocysteine lyase